MSRWLAVNGWKPGLVLLVVCIFFTPPNPVVYVLCSLGVFVCLWWGLAVRVRRGFLEGYRDDRRDHS